MNVLASIQTTNLDAEDPTRDFILQAWTRISSTLGRDFEQFLVRSLPPSPPFYSLRDDYKNVT